MLLPIVACAALIDDGQSEEERVVGSMGHMTHVAVPFLYRVVLILRPFRPLDRVFVAGAAELYSRRLQERRLCRRMGSMAAQTAPLGKHRPVQLVFPECLVEHFTMTGPAQLEAFFFGAEGIRGGGILMTLVAHLARDGFMDVIV